MFLPVIGIDAHFSNSADLYLYCQTHIQPIPPPEPYLCHFVHLEMVLHDI